MRLSNSQYITLMREYDLRQAEARREQELRYQEIEDVLPEYMEASAKLTRLCSMEARARVLGEAGPHSGAELRFKVRELEKSMKKMLNDAGYPEDYLEMHYSCPDCRDTGFVNGRKCHCFHQAVVNVLYHQSGLEEVLSRENFDTFNLNYYSDVADKDSMISPRENMEKVHARCKRFAEDFYEEGGNLLLYGNTGVGKTFLCHCIAKELLDSSFTVIYLSALKLMEILGDRAFGREQAEEDSELTDFIYECDLLIIDDLGSEISNAFVNSRLFDCINRRLGSFLSTVISTNLSLGELKDVYSERVFSRLLGNFELLPIIGEDIRIRKAITD